MFRRAKYVGGYMDLYGSADDLANTSGSIIAPTSEFFTEFLGADENPLSESNIWLNGQTDGLDWRDFQKISAHAAAAAFSSDGPNPPGHFNDAMAILKATTFACTPNQFAETVIFRAAAYNPVDTHEFGLFLRFSLSAHSAAGYEAYRNHAGNFAIVRWNGALDDFTPLFSVAAPIAADGDLYRFEAIGSTLTVYLNGSSIGTATDSTFASGQPGMQSYVMTTSTKENYCAQSFRAGNL